MAQYDPVSNTYTLDPAETAPFVMPENVGDAIVIGNDLANEITGNSANNSLEGGDGNDILRGGAGADTLVGSLGQDSYYVDDIGDVIIEDGADGMIDTVHSTISYILGANLETLRLSAGAGDIDGTGNDLDNFLYGNEGKNSLEGGKGNDVLDGGGGADTLKGGEGDDTYHYVTGTIIIEGVDEGFDRLVSAVSIDLREFANIEDLALTGADHISAIGNDSDNIIMGNDGDNAIDGGLGADEMRGGRGNDVYVVDDYGDSVTELFYEGNGGIDEVRASVSFWLDLYVENLVLTGDANIHGSGNSMDNHITGNGGNNLLWGDDGADVLSGGNGNDTLDGGGGFDILISGAGDDVYHLGAGDSVTEEASGGFDMIIAATHYALQDNGHVEALNAVAGTLNLNLTGANTNDILFGNLGNNVLNGRTGADKMSGNSGNDTYYVDNVGDQVIETGPDDGIDSVNTYISYTLTDYVENLTAVGSAAVSLKGNALMNSIAGNEAANVLDGAGGADRMEGKGGSDIYHVDHAHDSVIETAAGGTADLVYASISHTLYFYVENLTATGTDSINLTGNSSNNTIRGNSGANKINGILGKDTLYGGSGKDIFVFNTKPGASNVDKIMDYKVADDTIHLESAVFTKLKAGKLKSSAFWKGAKAHDKDDRVIYDSAKGYLYYDADGSGSKYKQVLIASLSKKLKMAASEFTII